MVIGRCSTLVPWTKALLICSYQKWWRSRKRRTRWTAVAHTRWRFSPWPELACPFFQGGLDGFSTCSSEVRSASWAVETSLLLTPLLRCRLSYPLCRSWDGRRCTHFYPVSQSASRCRLAMAGFWPHRCSWSALRTRRPHWSASKHLSRTQPECLPFSSCSAPPRESLQSRGCRPRVGNARGARKGLPVPREGEREVCFFHRQKSKSKTVLCTFCAVVLH